MPKDLNAKKILVADDSLTIQKVIRLALSNEGYEIQAASEGIDAAQQIAVFRPHVVLVDVSLPGKTAFQLKREINTMPDLAGVRFVLMSSAFEKVDETQAGEVGIHARLTKPFDPAHLRQVLTEVLGQAGVSSMDAPSRHEPPPLPPHAPPSKTAPPNLPPLSPDDVPEKISLDPPGEIELSDSQDTQEIEHVELTPPTPKAEPVSDDWLQPIKPVEPPPMPHSGTHRSDDSDIKELTEQTIKMSKLDEYDWSVDESSLKPLPETGDAGSSAFQIPPPPIESAPTQSPTRSSDADVYNAAPDFNDFATDEETTKILNQAPDPEPATGGYSFSTDPYAVPLPQKQMEELVRQQVRDTLEKMAQTVLPDIAEKIIKAEIHKLLNDQF